MLIETILMFGSQIICVLLLVVVLKNRFADMRMLSVLIMPLLLMATVQGFTTEQTAIIRQQFTKYGLAEGTAASDVLIASGVAFSEPAAGRMYIDAGRFSCARNAFTNVIGHECLHLLGHVHGDGHPLMSYVVTLDRNGYVLEDARIIDQ